MRGRNTFTPIEAQKIKELLLKKCKSNGTEQKKIRAELRNIGFYISDYKKSSIGFTLSDFNDQVEKGQIIIMK